MDLNISCIQNQSEMKLTNK